MHHYAQLGAQDCSDLVSLSLLPVSTAALLIAAFTTVSAGGAFLVSLHSLLSSNGSQDSIKMLSVSA